VCSDRGDRNGDGVWRERGLKRGEDFYREGGVMSERSEKRLKKTQRVWK